MRFLVCELLMLLKGKYLLKLLYNLEYIYFLYLKLVFLVCYLFGNFFVKKVFESKFFKLLWYFGEILFKNNMLDIYKSGKGFVVDGKLICFYYL